MVSIAEANTAVAKALTNMQRFNQVVNGGPDEMVGIDGNQQVRTLRGIQKYASGSVSGSASGKFVA